MKPLLISLSESSPLLESLQEQLHAECGEVERRQFPDGESYLRIISECHDRDVVIYCNLYRPDDQFLPLYFLLGTLKELGAKSVGLVTPYLPYMRQDKRFQSGEVITSRHFAQLLSQHLDWLVTVDPHLHRYTSLSEIYTTQAISLHAAPVIAQWIKNNLDQPLLIGPDSESEQWVAEVAKLAGAPFQVLSKIRHGDYDVEVSLPEVERWQQYTPVLVDDIISSGKTMMQTVSHLNHAGMKKAVCIGVHGLFANNAYETLSQSADVVTCDSIPHPSNQIALAELITQQVKQLL